jgi:hypothetical protein
VAPLRPQERTDFGVERGRAEPAVHDEEHQIGFGERGLGLQENLTPEGDVVPSQATCVDDAERALARRDDPVDAIPRHTGLIGHKGGAFLDEPIEQRALPDVRCADDRDERETIHVANRSMRSFALPTLSMCNC